MTKKHSAALIALYLLPWGIQFLVANFMPIYVASLPYANEETVGIVSALGSVVTMASQLLWTRFADRTAAKGRILALNLLLLAGFSVLFFLRNITLPLLLLITVLFYSCYMVHQPLIDTITAEACVKGGRSFPWFRSFASLGYGVMGIFFTVSPGKNPNSFFLYVVLLALVSAVISLFAPNTAPAPKTEKQNAKLSGGVLNRKFVLFLLYTFLSFLSSSTTNHR